MQKSKCNAKCKKHFIFILFEFSLFHFDFCCPDASGLPVGSYLILFFMKHSKEEKTLVLIKPDGVKGKFTSIKEPKRTLCFRSLPIFKIINPAPCLQGAG